MAETVYLCGPIVGKTYLQATGWRREVSDCLAPYGIETRDPMRDKSMLQDQVIEDHDLPVHPLLAPEAIVARDLADVMASQALLVNLLGVTGPLIGSCFEMAWAYQTRKPCVLVVEKEVESKLHPFIREACAFRVSTLAEAIDLLRSILGK